nr:unnamed protein product [Callosobruchus analis]
MDLQQHDDKFFNYLRMSESSFDGFLQKLSPAVSGTTNKFRPCISPKEKLVITLRYLASGCSFRELSHSFRIGHITIWKDIKDITFIEIDENKSLEISEG